MSTNFVGSQLAFRFGIDCRSFSIRRHGRFRSRLGVTMPHSSRRRQVLGPVEAASSDDHFGELLSDARFSRRSWVHQERRRSFRSEVRSLRVVTSSSAASNARYRGLPRVQCRNLTGRFPPFRSILGRDAAWRSSVCFVEMLHSLRRTARRLLTAQSSSMLSVTAKARTAAIAGVS